MTRAYRRYTKEELSAVVAECFSFAEVARKYGKSPVGGTCTNIRFMCQKWDIDTTHMTGQAHNRGKRSNKRLPPSERLVEGASADHRVAAHKLRLALDEIGRPHVCVECDLAEVWNGKSLTLEIDHINGKYWDNRADNLQYLCPNCHSQKPITV